MRNRKINKYKKLLKEGGYIKQSCGNYILFSDQDLTIYAINKFTRYIIIDIKNKTVYWRALTAYLTPYYWIKIISGYCKARYGFYPKVYDCKLDFIYRVFDGILDDQTYFGGTLDDGTLLYKRNKKDV